MDIIVFIPMGLILIIIVFLLAGAYAFIQALTKILFGIVAIFLFFYGIYVLIKGIVMSRREAEIGYGIVEIFRGIFISIVCGWVYYFLEIGQGHVSFENANYILLGRFDTLDIYMVTLFISVILVCIVSVPMLIVKNQKSSIIKYISMVLIMVSYISVYKIGLTSEFNNSSATFNWDSPEYEVIQDTDIKHEEFYENPIKTGTFKKGTLLYKNKYSLIFNGVEHFEVTDGKKVGYVSSKDLKILVRYTYIVNCDSPVYEVTQKQVDAWDIGTGIKHKTTIRVPGKVVTTLEKGMIVNWKGSQSQGYLLIKLPNGTEGFIERKNIDEIRE